jgi:hypothetical protein
MKHFIVAFLSTAAICAFVSATPVAAQETITGAPQGQTPITAEPPGPAYDNNNNPLGAVGAIVAAPFDAISGRTANATRPEARCHVDRDFYGSQGRYTVVCGP